MEILLQAEPGRNWLKAPFRLDGRLAAWLCGDDLPDAAIRCTVTDGESELPPAILTEAEIEETASMLQAQSGTAFLHVSGESGSGRRHFARHVARRLGWELLEVPFDAVGEDGELNPVVWRRVLRELLLSDRLLCYVGIVSLVGIVVNNGIVLVDFTNQLVREKMPVRKACILAGRNRLRPILMTTLTTVLGMLPMAFFPGEGAESMQPMCLTLVGGLMSGAFMTLFVSPVLYALLNRRREKRFDDPESLMNQMAELDEMEGRKKVALSTGLVD